MTRRSVAHEVLNSDRFAAGLVAVANKTGKRLDAARQEAASALREMVSVQIPFFGFLFDRVLGPLHTRAWSVDIDRAALERLKTENATKSLVFLPAHRSYADPYIVAKVLRSAGMPRNHIIGGDNLGFFPISTIGRRTGVVFIRRSFGDDEIYKLAMREYMRYLVAKRTSIEWYMEGGRSRTGKLRRPRYGLLRYLAEALDSGAGEDIVLVPVSITYDRLQEIETMAAEEAGAVKAKEGLAWLADYARAQGRNPGKAYVRFGETLSLRQARADGQPRRWTIDNIAFEVFQRINNVTPVTAPALATLTLLSSHDHALTLQEVHNVIAPLIDYAAERNLPTAALGGLHGNGGVEEVLDSLVRAGVVGRHDGGLAAVFHIRPGQHSVAAHYRNSAIHWFTNRAIVEVAVMIVARAGGGQPTIDRIRDEALALRDLLKFEFFFSEKSVFLEQIRSEAELLDPGWRGSDVPRPAPAGLLERAPFLIAHRVLPAFLEAYFIVADRLAAQPPDMPIVERSFLAQCTAVGRQYVLQKRLRNPECVSREVFGNALALAANRGLLQPGADELVSRRRRFAEESAGAVAAVAAIGELDYRRHHGAQAQQ